MFEGFIIPSKDEFTFIHLKGKRIIDKRSYTYIDVLLERNLKERLRLILQNRLNNNKELRDDIKTDAHRYLYDEQYYAKSKNAEIDLSEVNIKCLESIIDVPKPSSLARIVSTARDYRLMIEDFGLPPIDE